jgi:hypothetical protein
VRNVINLLILGRSVVRLTPHLPIITIIIVNTATCMEDTNAGQERACHRKTNSNSSGETSRSLLENMSVSLDTSHTLASDVGDRNGDPSVDDRNSSVCGVHKDADRCSFSSTNITKIMFT